MIRDQFEELCKEKRQFFYMQVFKETHDITLSEWQVTVFFARLKRWDALNKVMCHPQKLKILATLLQMMIRMDQFKKKRKQNKINYLSERISINEIVTFESVKKILERLDDEKLMDCLNRLPDWYIDLLFLVFYCNLSIDEIAIVLNQKKSVLNYSFNQGNILLQKYSYEG